MTDQEKKALKQELNQLESKQELGLTEEENKRIIQIICLLQPPLEDLCKQVSERQFMNMTEFSKHSVAERLEFYHKNCKKD